MKQNKSTGIMQNITNFIKTQESKTGCLLYLHTPTHTHTHTHLHCSHPTALNTRTWKVDN